MHTHALTTTITTKSRNHMDYSFVHIVIVRRFNKETSKRQQNVQTRSIGIMFQSDCALCATLSAVIWMEHTLVKCIIFETLSLIFSVLDYFIKDKVTTFFPALFAVDM